MGWETSKYDRGLRWDQSHDNESGHEESAPVNNYGVSTLGEWTGICWHDPKNLGIQCHELEGKSTVIYRNLIFGGVRYQTWHRPYLPASAVSYQANENTKHEVVYHQLARKHMPDVAFYYIVRIGAWKKISRSMLQPTAVMRKCDDRNSAQYPWLTRRVSKLVYWWQLRTAWTCAIAQVYQFSVLDLFMKGFTLGSTDSIPSGCPSAGAGEVARSSNDSGI